MKAIKQVIESNWVGCLLVVLAALYAVFAIVEGIAGLQVAIAATVGLIALLVVVVVVATVRLVLTEMAALRADRNRLIYLCQCLRAARQRETWPGIRLTITSEALAILDNLNQKES